MYERPVLNHIGKPTDVILGVISWGDDMDGSIIVQGFEFAAEDLDEA